MKAILPIVYIGNIEYYTILNRAEEVILDRHENFRKQSFRNRTEIYGGFGKHSLTIPIKKHPNHTPIHKIEVFNESRLLSGWLKTHWKSIETVYRSSPYFEYYEDEFFPIFTGEKKNLIEFNLELQSKIIELLQIEPKITFTESYISQKEDFTDYRKEFNPKTKSLSFPDSPYNQVFEDKYGFIPNLFILDLLFNEGPNSISFL